MRFLFSSLLVLSILILSNAYQQIRLKKDQYGFPIGDQNGDLHIQFFMDFLCDDTKNSYLEIKKVMEEVDFYKNGIKFTYQFSPLSWHFHSYKINQAFFFIWQKVGAQQAQKFIAYVLSNQEQFKQEKWVNKKISQFLDYFVEKISGVIKIDKEQFRSELNSGQTWNTVRHHWKYSVGTHSISSTPTFIMNSVRIDGAQNFSANQWIDFLDQFKKIKSKPNLSVDSFYLQLINQKGGN